ncbi:MAG: SRPBCC family protein [Planktotalea sp.]|uniref:SRPBCC family protein n=1 Tax=Planktotalea sp. TaxID=2029877 RepID=UPI003C717AC6
MRIIKRILTILVVLIVVLVALAYVLPRKVMVARSIEIDAPAGQVFAKVNGLKAGADWSPWLSRDPEVKLTYSGPDTGVGSKLEWTSEHPQVGNGKQEIVESVPNERVVTALDFGEMGTAMAAFTLVEASGKTTITWDLDTDMGMNPIGRYMGLMMDRWVGSDYEKGLANLKAMVEEG